jgi:hypothetical protein
MPLHLPKEINRYTEMKDKTFDIHMNVLDNARNAIELISFHGYSIVSLIQPYIIIH